MANSWSGLRKELEEDLLCEALKGRVQYFCTHYHGAPDQYGRICIRVDGREHMMGNPYSYDGKGYSALENRLKQQENIPRREWTGKGMLHEEENRSIEEYVHAQAIKNGDFEIYDITEAINEYKKSPIEKNLYSHNPIVRAFAVMDRRVGKRSLKKLEAQLKEQPEWLQFFYRLRLEAEETFGKAQG